MYIRHATEASASRRGRVVHSSDRFTLKGNLVSHVGLDIYNRIVDELCNTSRRDLICRPLI